MHAKTYHNFEYELQNATSVLKKAKNISKEDNDRMWSFAEILKNKRYNYVTVDRSSLNFWYSSLSMTAFRCWATSQTS